MRPHSIIEWGLMRFLDKYIDSQLFLKVVVTILVKLTFVGIPIWGENGTAFMQKF